jgi:hypothetical protein
VTDVEAVVKRFKTELYNCVGFIQEPKKLKESVKQLYQKYVQDDTVCQICVTHVKLYLLIWHRIWGKIVEEFLPTNSETYYFVPHFIFDAETMFPGSPDTTVKRPHIGNIGRYIRKTENSIVLTKL